jgi:hypothetical protein
MRPVFDDVGDHIIYITLTDNNIMPLSTDYSFKIIVNYDKNYFDNIMQPVIPKPDDSDILNPRIKSISGIREVIIEF